MDNEIKITKQQMELLASLIVRNLKCDCGCTHKVAQKQPCLCGWGPIEEWFDENCGMTLKIYREAMDSFYREYKYLEMFGNLNHYEQ